MEGTKDAPRGRLDAMELKLIAMALMLSDHIWYVFFRKPPIAWLGWMTWIGRLAFPIFAFQIAEGFAHTHSLKRYCLRLFLFGLISEIPFNLMVGGKLLYPNHQNVMFTFCLALPLLALVKKARGKGTRVYALTAVGCAALGLVAGYLCQTDYTGEGILTVLLFYLFRDVRFGRFKQLVGMLLINVGLLGNHAVHWFYLDLKMYSGQASSWLSLGGYEFPMPILGPGGRWALSDQAFAVLALIPIWLYSGKQGRHSRALQLACYAFYPAHMLILALLKMFLRAA